MKIITSKKRTSSMVAKNIGEATTYTSPDKESGFVNSKLLLEATNTHPIVRATLDVLSRSVIGAGWSFIPVEGYEDEATEESLLEIQRFFDFENRDWDNINDFLTLSDKFFMTVYRYYALGACAWEIVRNKQTGEPLGFDVLSGYIKPLVDQNGFFKNPAFEFRPWDGNKKTYYKSNEIVYFHNPGLTGQNDGDSLYSSLATTTIPSDLYASVAFREVFKNSNTPHNGIWEVDPDVSDEDFDDFRVLLEERYSGPENYGRNPLLLRGAAKFVEMNNRTKENAPYLDGRNFNREEIYAVTGVDGNKLGITDSSNKANIRETRREFHENVARPLFRRIEKIIYHQVLDRIFGTKAWMLRFNQPDITNAIEQATIDARYMQWGVYSPNEVRVQHGEKPREGGDIYYLPTNMQATDGGNEDRGNEAERPPRDEESPDSTALLKEAKQWRKFHLKKMDGKNNNRDFKTVYISPVLTNLVNRELQKAANNFDQAKYVFDTLEETIKEYG